VLFFVETPCSRLVKAACDCQLAHEHDESECIHNSVMDGASDDDGAGGVTSSRLRSSHARH
jgi:hypothetical protein